MRTGTSKHAKIKPLIKGSFVTPVCQAEHNQGQCTRNRLHTKKYTEISWEWCNTDEGREKGTGIFTHMAITYY